MKTQSKSILIYGMFFLLLEACHFNLVPKFQKIDRYHLLFKGDPVDNKCEFLGDKKRLYISKVEFSMPFQGRKIAYLNEEGKLVNLNGLQWSAPLSNMFNDVFEMELRRSFSDFKGLEVLSEASNLPSDYSIQVRVHKLQLEESDKLKIKGILKIMKTAISQDKYVIITDRVDINMKNEDYIRKSISKLLGKFTNKISKKISEELCE